MTTDAQTDLLFQMGRLSLAQKTVLITGASGGIGRSLSAVFRQTGCNLVLVGSNEEKLKKLEQDLPAGNGKVYTYVCDLRATAQIAKMVETTVKETPPIDILINNAGFALGATAPFWEQDLSNVDSVLGVNVNGLMAITHYVLKLHMIPRKPHGHGTILNISSITGHQAPLKEGFEASYHTSKAAVEGFTNVLRNETIGTNIRVLAHRPGTAHSEFHSRRLEYSDDKITSMFDGMGALEPMDLAIGCLWQCLMPERISVVMMETLPTAQRSNYACDREWEKRNGATQRWAPRQEEKQEQ